MNADNVTLASTLTIFCIDTLLEGVIAGLPAWMAPRIFAKRGNSSPKSPPLSTRLIHERSGSEVT